MYFDFLFCISCSSYVVLMCRIYQRSTVDIFNSRKKRKNICLLFRIKKKRKKEEEVESNINSHDPSLSPTSFLSNLSKEKEKKKKPILPSPPPLSDIAERPVEPEPAQTEPTPIPNSPSTSPSNETPKIEAEKEVVEEPQASPETPNSAESPPKPTKSKLIWSGSISMLDLSTFKANVYPVSSRLTHFRSFFCFQYYSSRRV